MARQPAAVLVASFPGQGVLQLPQRGAYEQGYVRHDGEACDRHRRSLRLPRNQAHPRRHRRDGFALLEQAKNIVPVGAKFIDSSLGFGVVRQTYLEFFAVEPEADAQKLGALQKFGYASIRNPPGG